MKTTITAPKGAWKGIAFKFGALLLAALFLTATTGSVFAQNTTAPLPQISAEKLRQDLRALQDSLERLHPGMFRYQTKKALDKEFDRSYGEIDRPMTVTEYFKFVDHLVGQLDDGHTECYLPGEANQWLKANAGVFPLGLWLSGEHAYVLCNTLNFSAGTEILNVNGRPMQKIICEMLGELSSDGVNLTGKYDKINRGHDPFPYLYFVLNGSKENFHVVYQNPDGTNASQTIPARKVNEVECIPNQPQTAKYLSLEYKPGGIAVLTIRSLFNELLDRTGEKFGDFLFYTFKELQEKNINKLVIDLRGNGGGDDTNGALLYSYLTDKPFPYYERLDKINGPYTNHPNLALQQPLPGHYTGKVFFLTNGGTFSSTAEFAAIAKSNNRGLFIGEETGGGYYGNTSGERTTIFLPNTKIRVNIPLTRYTLAVKPLKHGGRGVLPDVEVEPTINDKVTDRDAQMEKALQLAEKAD